jgi:hypothetical protein
MTGRITAFFAAGKKPADDLVGGGLPGVQHFGGFRQRLPGGVEEPLYRPSRQARDAKVRRGRPPAHSRIAPGRELANVRHDLECGVRRRQGRDDLVGPAGRRGTRLDAGTVYDGLVIGHNYLPL